MRRVNLLPPEERRRPAERLRGGAPAVLLIVGAVALIAMVGVYLFFLMRLNGVEDEIAELDQRIAEQNERLAELAPYRELQARLDAKKPVADGIFRTRFPWDEFLQGLAFVIPETTALDTFTAEAAPIDIQAPVEQPLEPPGAVTFTGIALPRYLNVADFVVQMNNLRYLADTQLNLAELDRTTFAQPAINFEVASELITVVGENGTEVRIDEGSLDEVANTAAENRYQGRVGGPRIGRQ
jgi:type IV pilus assembly protein PilN